MTFSRPVDIFDQVASVVAGRELTGAAADSFLDNDMQKFCPAVQDEIFEFQEIHGDLAPAEELPLLKMRIDAIQAAYDAQEGSTPSAIEIHAPAPTLQA